MCFEKMSKCWENKQNVANDGEIRYSPIMELFLIIVKSRIDKNPKLQGETP